MESKFDGINEIKLLQISWKKKKKKKEAGFLYTKKEIVTKVQKGEKAKNQIFYLLLINLGKIPNLFKLNK